MRERDLHSYIVACDFRVDDVEAMWTWLQGHRGGLLEIGAHHVVVYESIWEPGRVLVTIGIRDPRTIPDVLRSPAVFEWFDISGADDIPPVFGGCVVEKIDLAGPTSERHVGRVVVGVMSSVADVPTLMLRVHDGLARFESGGVRKIWVYRAVDDGHEVMILQEVEDEVCARQWLDHPDTAAEWMAHAGMGAYPTHFVGRFSHLMSVGQG
jgi:hypothetical protein